MISKKLEFERNISVKKRFSNFIVSQFKLHSMSVERLRYIISKISVAFNTQFLLLDTSTPTVMLYKVSLDRSCSKGKIGKAMFTYGVTKQHLVLPIDKYGDSWYLMPYSTQTEGLYMGINILDG